MISKRSAYRGCLLGLAVGDAMGYTVDTKTWPQIQEDYGPNGLQGYDLVNGYADVTSHTQLAVFTCNGLLFGMTRGQVLGRMAPLVRYAALAQKEWAAGQRRYDQPQRTYCWAFKVPELRRRHCTDTRMVETLNRDLIGSLEEPSTRHDTPASIAAAISAGLFGNPKRMEQTEIDRLGAECVALTHGHPLAFLPGAMIAHLISKCLHNPETSLVELVNDALTALKEQFGRDYPRPVKEIFDRIDLAMALSQDRNVAPLAAMEELKCDTGADVLAGAIYAALLWENDFDSAMIAAVNHSGRSAAVGCLTGAILGARMGDEALPEFYLECLEVADALREMADDLMQGCPLTRGSQLFDADWEQKYLHGER